ncbi:hypothetical protein AC229_1292 [Oenococcus oeni]|nr:hypothetical protein AC229_1292 [Oenococcus oeni]
MQATMANAIAVGKTRLYPPAITRTLVTIGPTIWPRVVAMFKIPRSLPASSLDGRTSTFSA